MCYEDRIQRSLVASGGVDGNRSPMREYVDTDVDRSYVEEKDSRDLLSTEPAFPQGYALEAVESPSTANPEESEELSATPRDALMSAGSFSLDVTLQQSGLGSIGTLVFGCGGGSLLIGCCGLP